MPRNLLSPGVWGLRWICRWRKHHEWQPTDHPRVVQCFICLAESHIWDGDFTGALGPWDNHLVLSLRERAKECPTCKWSGKLLHWLHEPSPPCPTCGVTTVDGGPRHFAHATPVFGDSFPGGYYVEHGLCNADGSPRRYDSKTEIRAEAARRGLTISGETPKDSGARWV